jgi:hypothetical protein
MPAVGAHGCHRQQGRKEEGRSVLVKTANKHSVWRSLTGELLIPRCIASMKIPRMRDQIAKQWRQILQVPRNQMCHFALSLQYAVHRKQS